MVPPRAGIPGAVHTIHGRWPFFPTANGGRRGSNGWLCRPCRAAPTIWPPRRSPGRRPVPPDPQVPEALHLAVRATRHGCTDNETSQWSKKAFQLLHRRYPKSEWAVKTKYHY